MINHWDEPCYAAYLAAPGLDHPRKEAVIAAGQIAPEAVAAACLGPHPGGQPLLYQKHMTQHMIPEFDRGFMKALTNVFLIRHPARVVASYSRKREAPTLADIGFVQQAELFDQVADWLGRAPVVVDSAGIRANPRETLEKLFDDWKSGAIIELLTKADAAQRAKPVEAVNYCIHVLALESGHQGAVTRLNLLQTHLSECFTDSFYKGKIVQKDGSHVRKVLKKQHLCLQTLFASQVSPSLSPEKRSCEKLRRKRNLGKRFITQSHVTQRMDADLFASSDRAARTFSS